MNPEAADDTNVIALQPKRSALGGLVLLLAIICSGCFLYRYSPRPGVSGRIVDGRTGFRLADAEVEVIATQAGERTMKTNTAPDGSFHISARRQWGSYIVPIDVFFKEFRVTVRHEGYCQADVRFEHWPMATGAESMRDFGQITLRRADK